MIRASGRVLAVSTDSLSVETTRRSACGRCSTSGGCGQGLLASVADRGYRIEVGLGGRSPAEFEVGQLVELALPGNALLHAAALAWLIPLLLLVTGLLVGSRISDLWGVVGALTGLGLGWIALRHRLFLSPAAHTPMLLTGPSPLPIACPSEGAR